MGEFNFDNSLLKDFAECIVRGVVKHRFGLRGKGEKIAADIGNAYHAALELHFQGQSTPVVVERFKQEYDQIIPPGQQPEEKRFERQNCIDIMEQYCEVRPVEHYSFRPVSFEQVRGIELARDEQGELVFWVKRDMLVEDKAGGQRYPLDHKTTGKVTAWWAKKFRQSSQLSGYAWFTRQETGSPVGQVGVNAIEVAALPGSSKRCATHGVPYLQCRLDHCVFQVFTYERTEDQLEAWKRDAIELAKMARTYMSVFQTIEMLRYAPRTGAFSESCIFCEVKDWCAAGFEPKMCEALTVYDPWTPWEKGKRIDRTAVAVQQVAAIPEPSPTFYGFEILTPGTDAWMQWWKDNPGHQRAMIDFQQRAGS